MQNINTTFLQKLDEIVLQTGTYNLQVMKWLAPLDKKNETTKARSITCLLVKIIRTNSNNVSIAIGFNPTGKLEEIDINTCSVIENAKVERLTWKDIVIFIFGYQISVFPPYDEITSGTMTCVELGLRLLTLRLESELVLDPMAKIRDTTRNKLLKQCGAVIEVLQKERAHLASD